MNEEKQSLKFLSIYNELDKFMRDQLGVDDSKSHTALIDDMAKRNSAFRYNMNDLKLYAKLRNTIVHNPFILKIDPIAEPHQEIVQGYEELKNSAIHPPVALEKIAVRISDMRTTSLEENAFSVMQTMNIKNFTHIPVLIGGKVFGIFSENTVFSYFVNQKEAIFDETMKIEDFKEVIQPDFPKSETFRFVRRSSTVHDIEEIFGKEFKCHKRVAAIYITETGKQSESLLGMITPWDVLGNT